MSTKLFDLRKQKQDLLAKAEAIINKAERENKRPLTAQEAADVDAALMEAKTLTPQIHAIEAENTCPRVP